MLEIHNRELLVFYIHELLSIFLESGNITTSDEEVVVDAHHKSASILGEVDLGRFKFRDDAKSPSTMNLVLDGLLDSLFE